MIKNFREGFAVNVIIGAFVVLMLCAVPMLLLALPLLLALACVGAIARRIGSGD